MRRWKTTVLTRYAGEGEHRKWVKTGIEFIHGKPHVSTVACDRWVWNVTSRFPKFHLSYYSDIAAPLEPPSILRFVCLAVRRTSLVVEPGV